MTHVASRRHVFKEPLPPPSGPDTIQWFARHQLIMEMVARADLVDIGLPLDGETFTDASPGEAADRLIELREAGYNVPQYAIDELRVEDGGA